MDERLKAITEKIDGLKSELAELVEQAQGSASSEEVEGFKAKIDTLEESIKPLEQEKKERERALEIEGIKAHSETLQSQLDELRKPAGEFRIGGGKAADEGSNPYEDGDHSFFKDITLANRGLPEARERLGSFLDESGQKAMTEGTGSQGGYLVVKQIERQLVEAIELSNVLRDLCTKVNVSTNAVEFDRIQLGTTAGWVAEQGTKPESTSLSLSTITANIFTAAGLATISNQLLADSVPSVDGLVITDLAKRLRALEEDAFLNGDGTGKPLGLLNTSGVQTTTVTNTDPANTAGLLNGILDSITKVQDVGLNPNAILMHPRTWTTIVKARDSVNHFFIDAAVINERGPVYSYQRNLFGLPVVLSNRVPTNLGGSTTESRVVVGDFSEAIILDRQGVTVDQSPHVYFTTNQTVFRAEKRVGFTAARIPTAFCVIGGAGLAGG